MNSERKYLFEDKNKRKEYCVTPTGGKKAKQEEIWTPFTLKSQHKSDSLTFPLRMGDYYNKARKMKQLNIISWSQ